MVSLEPALARFPHYINFFYDKYSGASSCSMMSTSCLIIVSSGLNTDSRCLLIPIPVVGPEGLHVGGCVPAISCTSCLLIPVPEYWGLCS